MAYLFAANGIAALIYDKRGCGESSGKEWRAPFKDYAKDLLAGVRYLTTLPTIDSLRIGLYGHSQGAWVVPLAYSFHSERIAFCILSAGNAVSPVEQMLMAGDQELTLLGKDAVTIRDVHEFRRLKYSVGITGRGRKEYLSTSLPEAERESWFKLTGGALPDDKFWEANGFYDERQPHDVEGPRQGVHEQATTDDRPIRGWLSRDAGRVDEGEGWVAWRAKLRCFGPFL
jgi:pimeloyl-ACP methyl ester carboxylesterase